MVIQTVMLKAVQSFFIVDKNIVALQDFENLISAREDGMSLILTGRVMPEKLRSCVDIISTINYIEVDKDN